MGEAFKSEHAGRCSGLSQWRWLSWRSRWTRWTRWSWWSWWSWRSERAQRPWEGAGLLLVGLLALGRAHVAALALARAPPDPATLGEAIALDVEALQGADFRLLPGVGPVLAARLEEARRAAGGTLHPADLRSIPGVGPSLRRRWEALRSR
jgi:hypothetical protein